MIQQLLNIKMIWGLTPSPAHLSSLLPILPPTLSYLVVHLYLLVHKLQVEGLHPANLDHLLILPTPQNCYLVSDKTNKTNQKCYLRVKILLFFCLFTYFSHLFLCWEESRGTVQKILIIIRYINLKTAVIVGITIYIYHFKISFLKCNEILLKLQLSASSI